MTRPPARRSGAQQSRCPRCRGPVLRQLVGQHAAVGVTADAEHLAPAAAYALRTENRLDWCLRTTRDGLDLRWADCHRRAGECPHPHVIDHECTAPPVPIQPAARRPARIPTPVPAGQLTL
ncbi:hypothetical protein OIE71_04580 [Streptomyces sp. NBC_01725]|uniref:hypothetical protein n=1 Tax=Streptomyces sp. NBC_01725 TaxID=2975923 RepID=UPI002E2CE25C|nr:hypothetical protein [Streptomyces sp. NBC_01725]